MTTADPAPTRGGVFLPQTRALLLDGYRRINASALFWITLLLSLVVVSLIALPTIDDRGVSLFGFVLFPMLTPNLVPPDVFYKSLFTSIGLTAPLIAWLTIWANVLAIVSTAGIFPNLLSGGSIDLYLSKPLGRLRLFLTVYVIGLLFAALQVTVFCVGGFLIIGIRGGSWEPAVFLAVPLVVLIFSYVWSISTLIGVWSRSTLMAILVTVLLWGLFGLVQFAETFIILPQAVQTELAVERNDATIERFETIVAKQSKPDDENAKPSPFQLQLDSARERSAGLQSTADAWGLAHDITFAIYMVLPKTADTARLTERWLIDAAELGPMGEEDEDPGLENEADVDVDFSDPEIGERMEAAITSRSPVMIIGTSLLIEFAVLGVAAWIFARRDY
ncbi:MAG: ABC transporter permease [Planctomycetota bacterium]